jgi:AraC-like DNA-binding protein
MTYTLPTIPFGTGLSIIMAISLFLKPLRFRNCILAILLLQLSFVQFFAYLIDAGLIENHYILFFLSIPIIATIGPTVFFYLKNLTGIKDRLVLSDLIHFLPAFIYITFIIPYLIKPSETKIALVYNFFNKGVIELQIPIIISLILSLIYVIISITIGLKKIKTENPAQQKILMLLILLLTFTIFIHLFIIMTIATVQFSSLKYHNHIVLILILSLFFLAERYPYLLGYGIIPIKKKNKKSHLNNIDIQNLDKQLKILMDEERFYCDEDLSLKKLSQVLEITTHQLSQFLNCHYNKNFNSFLNSYRIAETKTLLIEDPSRNTLSIAYSSGFNSYSAFHGAFKKETGLSPARYRNKKLKNLK